MPKYTNNTASPITAPGAGPTIAPGNSVITTEYLEDPCGLTLDEYGDSPISKLHGGSLPATITGTAAYEQLTIKNGTNADISIVFNEDSSNALVLFAGEIQEIAQDRTIEKAVITGSGAGNVYVYGVE